MKRENKGIDDGISLNDYFVAFCEKLQKEYHFIIDMRNFVFRAWEASPKVSCQKQKYVEIKHKGESNVLACYYIFQHFCTQYDKSTLNICRSACADPEGGGGGGTGGPAPPP